MNGSELNVFFSAGEASGDLLAANLFEELKRLHTNLKAYGITGPEMEKSGIKTLFSNSLFEIMGITEILKKVDFFNHFQKKLLKNLEDNPPDLVILVDNQEFHHSLGEQLKQRQIPCILYVAPQVWAWRKKRAEILHKKFDMILGILPFERDFFSSYPIHYEFIGSPVFDRCLPFFKKNVKPSAKYKISFFPGSRKQELQMMTKNFLDIAAYLIPKKCQLTFHIRESFSEEFIHKTLKKLKSELKGSLLHFKNKEGQTLTLSVSRENSLSLMSKSDYAFVTSGTASLECSFIGTPSNTVYKMGHLNYLLARTLVKVPYISLANLILKKEMVKESIQNLDPISLGEEALSFLENRKNHLIFEENLQNLRSLFHENSSQKAAKTILRFFSDKKRSPIF